MQAYLNEQTSRHKEMLEKQKVSSSQEQSNVSQQTEKESQPQLHNSFNNSSYISNIASNHDKNVLQQHKLLPHQQHETSIATIQSSSAKQAHEAQDTFSSSIKSLIDAQQLNNINVLKSSKEDL